MAPVGESRGQNIELPPTPCPRREGFEEMKKQFPICSGSLRREIPRLPIRPPAHPQEYRADRLPVTDEAIDDPDKYLSNLVVASYQEG